MYFEARPGLRRICATVLFAVLGVLSLGAYTPRETKPPAQTNVAPYVSAWVLNPGGRHPPLTPMHHETPTPVKHKHKKKKPTMKHLRHLFKRGFIRGARHFLGVHEVPWGTNYGRTVQRFLRHAGLGPGYPWCAAFLWYIADAYGHYRGPHPSNLAYVPSMCAFASRHHLHVEKYKVQPGMVVTLSSHGHVALVIRRDGHLIQTIGGNESDAVRKQWRRISEVNCVIDLAKALRRP